jgi:predicted nucleotidyltransferase
MLTHKHPLYKQTKQMLEGSIARGECRKDVDLEVLIYIMLGTNATMLMLGETHKKVSSDEIADRFAAEWGRILAGGIFREPR